MKAIAVLFLGLSLNSFSQDVALELRDMNALYRGYSTAITVTVSNSKKEDVILKCDACDTIFHMEENKYAVKPGSSDKIVIDVFLKKRKKELMIASREYHVFDIPKPTLFIKSGANESKANSSSPVLIAKYDKSVPLTVKFLIKSWTLYANGESVSGVGSSLNNAREFLKALKKGDRVVIEANVLGPNGVMENVTGVFVN